MVRWAEYSERLYSIFGVEHNSEAVREPVKALSRVFVLLILDGMRGCKLLLQKTSDWLVHWCIETHLFHQSIRIRLVYLPDNRPVLRNHAQLGLPEDNEELSFDFPFFKCSEYGGLSKTKDIHSVWEIV